MLIIVCRSYRTVSADSLQMVAGVLPNDLKVRERHDTYLAARNGIGNVTVIGRNYSALWQARWVESTKGRPLFQHWKDVTTRVKMKIYTDHYTKQFLTHHGNFLQYLCRSGLRISHCTTCGVDDPQDM